MTQRVITAGRDFCSYAAQAEKEFRRSATSAPSLDARVAFSDRFWQMLDELREAVGGRSGEEIPEVRRAFWDATDAVLMRGELFSRSRHRPHGYPGDFQTFERIYRLEAAPGTDPTVSAISNCLDYTYSTIAPPRAAWGRRHDLAGLIERRLAKGPLSILDVACGGSRYVRDVLDRSPHADRLTALCMDQDPAATAFVRRETEGRGARVETACVRLSDLAALLRGRSFDLAIASGLTDYLDDATARALFTVFAAHLEPSGMIYTSNLMDVDRSPFCLDWVGGWPIRYRTLAQTVALLPEAFSSETSVTEDGSLILVRAARR